MAKTTSTKKFTFRAKPCLNFQSIEFEMKGNEEDIPDLLRIYNVLLTGLIEIAPEQKQSREVKKTTEKQEPLISEKQMEVMAKFKIPFNHNMTMKQAQELIKASYEKRFYEK